MANDGVANFDTMRDMVLNTTERVRLIQKQIRRLILQDKLNQKTDSKSNGIPKRKTYVVTTHISRSIRSTINEKRTIDVLDTLPLGWVNETWCSIN
jgi:hypothetical protein